MDFFDSETFVDVRKTSVSTTCLVFTSLNYLQGSSFTSFLANFLY